MGNCVSSHTHRDQLRLREEGEENSNSNICIPIRSNKNKTKTKKDKNDFHDDVKEDSGWCEEQSSPNGGRKKQQPRQNFLASSASSPDGGDVTESSTDCDPNSPFSVVPSSTPRSPVTPSSAVTPSQHYSPTTSSTSRSGNNPKRTTSENGHYDNVTARRQNQQQPPPPPEEQQQQLSSSSSNLTSMNMTGPSNNNMLYYTMPVEELNPPHPTSTTRRRKSRHHHHHYPAGRALQERLERARNMQSVLSSSSGIIVPGGGRKNCGSLDNYYESSEDESTSSLSFQSNHQHRRRQYHHRTAISSKYSTLSNASDGTLTTATSTKSAGGDHRRNDATTTLLANTANTVWADINVEHGGAVLCTCFSRTKPSLLLSNSKQPPLFLAIGTASGLVQIQVLLSNDDDIDDNITVPPTIIGGTDDGSTQNEDHNNMNPPRNTRVGQKQQVRVSGKVRSLDFSTDGKFLAVGDDDGICTVFALHYDDGATHRSPAGNSGGLDSDPANNCNERLLLLRIDAVAEIPRIDRVCAVQFSPDNAYLAIGGFDGTVAIISTKEFDKASTNNNNNNKHRMIEPITEIPRDGLILTIDWSPDSRYLAIGGSDKCCAIVDVSSSWNVYKTIRRSTTIQSVKWYPNTGKYLAIGSSDIAIVVGRDSFTTTSEIDLRNSDEHNTNSAHSSPNSNSTEQTKEQRQGRSHTPTNHRSVYRTNAICWSPNGSYFAVCGSDKKCTILETHSFTIVHEITRPANITCVVWGQQSELMNSGTPRRYLAIGGEDKKVIILKAGVEINRGSSLADDYSHSAASSSYFSSSNNPSDWVLKDDLFRDMEDILETPTVTNHATNKDSNKHLSSTNVLNPDAKNSKGRNSTILALTFSKGSKSKPSHYFAYSTDDELVTVRHALDWKVVAEIQFSNVIQSLTFSNGTTNQYLVLGSIDSNVYISDASKDYSIIAKIELTAPVTSLSFSKNNERLAAGSQDGTFAFFDQSNNFEFCGEIEVTKAASVLAVDWSSKNLAIGRGDGTVSVYDTKQVINDVYVSVADIDRKAAVHSVALGVSSRFLAVGGADHCVGIYSSKGSWVLCHQVKMAAIVSSVRWSPVGRYLACCDTDGILKVIDTMFWADVAEPTEAVSPPILSKKTSSLSGHRGASHDKEQLWQSVSSLAFSQDGKFLAFTRGNHGLSILNSSTNWTVDFCLTNNNHNRETSSNADAAAESSSLSSYGEDIVSSDDNRDKHKKQDLSIAEDYYSSTNYNIESNLLFEV